MDESFPEHLSIDWLHQKYLNRQMTPENVIERIIERAHCDQRFNIWITPPSPELVHPFLERIQDIDPASSRLWGIPFAVKDNIDLMGVSTTAGCPQYKYQPETSSSVVKRLLSAGAIPVGKTNLDQFATGLVGVRSPFGETHNALKEELISGGSSSGSAVCVARGHAAFALGTDTAGSGRVPAALNGIIGFKPSFGAWPSKGVVPACASLDCVTVFVNELSDILDVDRVIRGIDDTDPWSRHLPDLKPRLPQRICLSEETMDFFGPYAKEYETSWQTAVARINTLQLQIATLDTRIFSEAAAMLYSGPWIAERWADIGTFAQSNPGALFPVTEQILRQGSDQRYTASLLFGCLHRLEALKLETRKLLKDAVLVMPTAGGTYTRAQVTEDPLGTNSRMGLYTNHCNLLDLCAIAIPTGHCHHSKDLPFGITLFALAENEDLIYGLAKMLLN